MIPGKPSLLHFNPQLNSREQIKAGFIAREELLQRHIDDLRKEKPSHWLIVGLRGMGKTTFLGRLGIAIQEDDQLSRRWIPLEFPEEQYNIARFEDFVLNCIDGIGDYLDREGKAGDAADLDARRDRIRELPTEARAAAALQLMRDEGRRLQRGFVLLIDNLNFVLDGLPVTDQLAFCKMLVENPVVMVGCSTLLPQPNQTEKIYPQALLDCIRVEALDRVGEVEAERILRRLAESQVSGPERADPARNPALKKFEDWLTSEKGKLPALIRLTDGNPRIIVMLAELIRDGNAGAIYDDLVSLIDRTTPYFKSLFEELSDQQQVLFHELAMHFEPMTAAELAEKADIPVTTVTGQLNRLVAQGYVNEVPNYPKESTTAFEVASRFFNIWILIRGSRRVRQRLRWLVEFLRLLYSQAELRVEGEARFGRTIDSEIGGDIRQQIEFKYALGMATESALHRELLKFDAIRDAAREQGLNDLLHELEEKGETKVLTFKSYQNSIDRLELKEEDSGAQVLLGALYSLKKETFSQSERAYKRAIELDSASVYAWNGLGNAVSDQGRKEEAEQHYRKALVLDPKFAVGWSNLGNAVSAQGRKEEAEQHYLKALELDPKHAHAWSGLGYAVSAQGRKEEAEQHFRKALELDPKYVYAWSGLGYVISAQGRKDEAEKHHRKALELDPKHVYAWSGLGYAVSDQGRKEEAEQHFRKALELDPKHVNAWSGLGNAVSAQGRKEEAEQHYRKALVLDPKFAVGWSNLGNAVSAQGRKEEAEQHYRKALELDPKYVRAWSGLGNAVSAQGRKEEAEGYYRKALGIDITYGRALNNLDRLYCELLNESRQKIEANHWAEAAGLAVKPLREMRDWGVENFWNDIVSFFTTAVAKNRAREVSDLLQECGRAEQWPALTAALKAVEEGNYKFLRRSAAEIRDPALEILKQLDPESRTGWNEKVAETPKHKKKKKKK